MEMASRPINEMAQAAADAAELVALA